MPAVTSRLVPTLAALTLAGAGLGALDDVAPVITLLDSEIQPAVPHVYQDETDPPAAFAASVLSDDLYLYDSGASLGYRWQEFDQSYRVTGSAGIAVIASSLGSASGQWQYRLADLGGAWTNLPSPAATDDANAFLLPTVRNVGYLQPTGLELRFLPSAGSPDGTPTLVFRAWDGSSGAAETTADTTRLDETETVVAGGSPTAYSAELRTIRVDVRSAANSAPVITDHDGIGGSTLDIHPGEEVFFPIDVDDVDGDDVTWSISSSYGSSFSAYFGFDSFSESYGLFLTGGETYDTITFTASDGHGGTADLVVSTNPVNDPPVIADPDGREAGAPIQIHAGDSIDLGSLNITASDPDTHDTSLAWSSGYTANYHYVSGTTFYASSTTGTDTATFTVSDAHGASDSITLTFDVLPPVNQDPEVTPYDGLYNGEGWYLPVVQGGDGTFTLRVSDPDGDAVAYDGFYDTGEGINSPSYGTLSAPSIATGQGFTDFTFTYSHDGSPAYYGDWFEVQFSDGQGGVTTLSIYIDVSENSAPYIDTPVPLIAVRGKPYSALVTIRDDDADDPITLAVTGLPASALVPVGPTLTKTGGYDNFSQRTYRLSFVPAAAGVQEIQLTTDDGASSDSDSFSITVADPAAAQVTEPAIPQSAPGAPVYAAIAPGSTDGWSSLMGALAPHGPDVARAWWWNTAAGAFFDAESVTVGATRQPSTALFLASTVSLSYSFDARPYPMPFAIDLPAADVQAEGPGTDGWTFFGVPALWDGSQTFTSHGLSDFVLETADGRRVSDSDDILIALAPSGDSVVQAPWSYDPAQPADSRYLAAPTLTTGAGYWIRNRSTTPYRLVRVSSEDRDGTRLHDVGNEVITARPAAIVSGAAAAADTPPAPPSGSTAVSKASDAGCGAGGLAGLLVAALALMGLGHRRRS